VLFRSMQAMWRRTNPEEPRRAALLEQRFQQVARRSEHTRWREVAGATSVVVSAPHAVAHLRNGARKGRDVCTGPLALALARLTGCAAIVADKRIGLDPNSADTPFGSRLFEMAAGRTIFDLHGAAARPGMDIGIGTGGGESLAGRLDLLDVVVDRLTGFGLAVVVDPPGLAAHGPARLVQLAAAKGISAMQVEVTDDFRSPATRPEDWKRAALALADAIQAVSAAA